MRMHKQKISEDFRTCIFSSNILSVLKNLSNCFCFATIEEKL